VVVATFVADPLAPMYQMVTGNMNNQEGKLHFGGIMLPSAPHKTGKSVQ